MKTSIKTMAVMLGVAMSVNAEALTNKKLMDYCESEVASEHSFCMGYIAGALSQADVAAYLTTRSAFSGLSEEEFDALPKEKVAKVKKDMAQAMYGCSEGKTYGQLAAVFVKWAKNNPEQWQDYPDYSISIAIREAFPSPCGY